MIPPPVVLGLTICEKAIVEEGTRNVTLVSTFTKLLVDSFPTPPQKFTAHVVLTEGLGTGIIDLVVSSLDTNREVYQARVPIRFPDRLMELRLLFNVTNCVFPAPGAYQLMLVLDGECLALRRFQVLAREKKS